MVRLLKTSPRIRLTRERAADARIVIVRGKCWGHAGLLVESRPRLGRLGGDRHPRQPVCVAATLRDTRPLAVRGQPEVREYRARFFDGTTEISGDWSPVEGVTVSV